MAIKKIPQSNHTIAAASKLLAVSDLEFDKENPRFPAKIANGPVELLLERFVRDERLLEIVESIGNHGFFPGEPLLVTPLPKGKYKVVEGNRRLAALKLLNRELPVPEGRTSITNALFSATVFPPEVPCLVFAAEDEILRYLGFRHITGIKAWGALQKARYAERLWGKYKEMPTEEGLKLLARETGSRSDYMGQILTTLALYDRAEAENFFDLGLSPDDIEFSVLSTALSYSSITEYLGLASRADLSLQGLVSKNLKEIMEWLFVTIGSKKAVVGESRNLRKLAAVVSSPAAVKELRLTLQLDDAYELSKGPELALTEALRFASRRLDTAFKLIPKTTSLSEEHLEYANQIKRTASIVHATIDNQLYAAIVAPPKALKRRTKNA
jgi:hypothetical protein